MPARRPTHPSGIRTAPDVLGELVGGIVAGTVAFITLSRVVSLVDAGLRTTPRSGLSADGTSEIGPASAIRSDRVPVRPGPRQMGTRSGHPTTGAHVDAWGLQPSARRRQSTAVLAGNPTANPQPDEQASAASPGMASRRKSVAGPPVPGRAYGTDGERSAMATAPAKPPTAMTRSVTRRPALGQPVYGVPNAQNRDSWFTQSGHPNSGTR